MKKTTLTLLLVAMLFSIAAGDATDLRPPTPAEKQVLAKYRTVIYSVLDSFNSPDWAEKDDFELDDKVLVSGDPAVPLDVDELIQRSYSVKEGSALFQKEVLPYITQMQSATPEQMAQIGRKMRRLQLEVEVHFNRAGIDSNPARRTSVAVSGPAMAIQGDLSQDKKIQTVQLLFGNWKSAVQGGDILAYHFQHPAHSAAIENVVIQLRGDPQRIQELLHSVNWKRVNDALS